MPAKSSIIDIAGWIDVVTGSLRGSNRHHEAQLVNKEM